MESDFKIAIIGLGLIGGSMAYALKGFKRANIVGCDKDAGIRAQALYNKAVTEAFENAGDAIEGSDLVIICTYPDAVIKIIEDNKDRFKKGAVITDVCGVKSRISEEICRVLPEGTDYVGCHPMAGKETDGFINACVELFWMTGFIIVPPKSAKPESIELLKSVAKYIGATRITQASPEDHDSIIAYTSDLMHISAAALCLDYNKKMNRAYTAGAFRDCTRIAHIAPELWTELFIANSEYTVAEIDRFITSLNRLRTAISEKDAKLLTEMLSEVRENKEIMQITEP